DEDGLLWESGIAIRPSWIADVVVSGEHRHARVLECQHRWHWGVARSIGHDRHVGFCQFRDRRLNGVIWRGTKRIRVGDRDAPLHPMSLGPFGNAIKLK